MRDERSGYGKTEKDAGREVKEVFGMKHTAGRGCKPIGRKWEKPSDNFHNAEVKDVGNNPGLSRRLGLSQGG
jgi:hypothetical protein